MFTTSHIHVPRHGRPSSMRPFFPTSSFGSAETKEPLRRGILFTTVASVLLLVGSILTWLGFNDVFGGRVSMTGPLLIALALLLLLLSMRQFLIARKRNTSSRNGLQLGQMGRGTVTAVVVDRNDGVGAVTVVMDSHSLEQDPHYRNSASSTLDDLEPPSYSEVTQCLPSNIPPPVVCQEEPPPPYEEAVVGGDRGSLGGAVRGIQGEELAPAYSPHGVHTGYAAGSSSIMTIPGQIPGTQCYHCHLFPTGTTSTGRLSPHSLCTGQVLGSQDLQPGTGRSWSSPRRFVLIPHFLGIFSNGRGDPAHSMHGELPPAYQPVDTTGRSPLTYVQAMGLTTPSGPDLLGVQSPHESRQPALQEVIDTYHPPVAKDNAVHSVPKSGVQNSSQAGAPGTNANSVGSSSVITLAPPAPSSRASSRSPSPLAFRTPRPHSATPSASSSSCVPATNSGPYSVSSSSTMSTGASTMSSLPGSTDHVFNLHNVPNPHPPTALNNMPSAQLPTTAGSGGVTHAQPRTVPTHSFSTPFNDEVEEIL